MIRTFLILAFFLSACDPQNSKYKPKKDRTYNQTLLALFEKGRHDVDFVINKEYTGYQKKVLIKLNKSVRLNEAWYEALIKNMKSGQGFRYDKNLGLTKNEFDTLLSIFPNDLPLTETGKITITINDNQIHFSGIGKLSLLDSLMINLNDSSVIFKNEHLRIADTAGFVKPDLPTDEYLESLLVYKGPGGIMGLLSGLAPANYTICIGRLGKSGKIFLEIKGKENTQDYPVYTQLTLSYY